MKKVNEYKKTELERVFSGTLTENGDAAFNTTGNKLVDLLFMSEYYTKNIDKVSIGCTYTEKIFSMFMRDPRFGMGYKDLGCRLMHLSGCNYNQVVKAGSFKDLVKYPYFYENNFNEFQTFLKREIDSGNELAKKWMPRYYSCGEKVSQYRKNKTLLARGIAKSWNMTKQEYGKYIKCNTVENKLSRHNLDDIKFESVPSIAMIKYFSYFNSNERTSERFNKYLEDVKNGKSKINVSTTTVYDIYKNREQIDPDLFFDKIEKIKISCVPVVDTSGSMYDLNDSIGKALSIGHYLGKCSTYCPNQIVTFSSDPHLITLGEENETLRNKYYRVRSYNLKDCKTKYDREINSMITGDCSNTDIAKVFNLFSGMKSELPDYIVVLSDMQFDDGGERSKEACMNALKERGFKTKLIWWNFNSRSKTAPEKDEHGNIFISGYNPMLLKYLECGFDATQFIDKLLEQYEKNIA